MNPRIKADTMAVCSLQFSHIRLMNDNRWPWFIVLPNEAISPVGSQSASSELHHLLPEIRTGMLSDVNALSDIVQHLTRCRSVNIAMLGNVVPDLHCHVVARDEGDANWPKPVWGFGTAVPYSETPTKLIKAVQDHFIS